MKKNPRPTTLPLPDERNVARLGIVSVQSRLAEETTRTWTANFEVAGRSFGVAAEAPHGRPRGIDTNVVLGIEQLFAAQSCPEDNRLHTTAYELRAASFLPLNGKSFHRLRESLDRLWYTSVTVTDGWHLPDGRKLRNVKRMRLINDLSYWDIDSSEALSGRELVPNATMSIQLGTQMANSIRSGFTQALETKILQSIEQPPARALYRLLEAHRYADTGEQLKVLPVRLEDWRLACGIAEGKPSKTLRALGEAHDELVAQGYLRDVTTSGARGTMALRYEFASPDDPDPTLVRLLVANGVAAPAANKLAKTYESRVEDVVRHVQYQRSIGKKPRNPGGLIRDMLVQPEKYVLDPGPEPVETRDGTQERLLAAERSAQLHIDAQRHELLSLPPAAQWQKSRGALKLQLGKQLPGPLWEALERACQRGEIEAGVLVQDLSVALARLELQQFVDNLRERLR